MQTKHPSYRLTETDLRAIFPAGQRFSVGARHGVEFLVAGLPDGCEPAGCEILASGRRRVASAERREDHYLVVTERHILFFRIQPNAATSNTQLTNGPCYAALDSREAAGLEKIAREYIATVCVPLAAKE